MLLRSESSWTCGVFLVGPGLEPPQAQYYQLPSLRAECPASFRDTWKVRAVTYYYGEM